MNPAALAAFSKFVYSDTAAASSYPARIPSNFQRVEVAFSTANGFYASAFHNTQTNQLVIAFRGTDDFSDWLLNNPSFLPGPGQSPPPQFAQAKQFLTDAKAAVAGINDANIVLTGHSLGGGLAAMVSVVTGLEAHTFNAPQVGHLLGQLRAQTPGAPTLADPSKVKKYWATTDKAHLFGESFGDLVDETTIAAPSFKGQLVAFVTGALLAPVFKLPSLISSIASWGANRTIDQHEMDKLIIPLSIKYGIVPLTLQNGLPTDDSSVEGQAYKSRVLDTLAPNLTSGDKQLIENRSIDRIFIDGVLPGDSPDKLQDSSHFGSSRDLVIGNEGRDSLRSGAQDDVVFGGEGGDSIDGGTGSDLLVGGAGKDVYFLKSGDGQDTLIDNDGTGILIRNGSKIALGIKSGIDTWQFAGATYSRIGTDLRITFADEAGDIVTIRNFDFAQAGNGYLGIRLVDAQSAPTNPSREFSGDKQDWDSNPGEAGVQMQDDGFGNSVRADGQGGRPDLAQADRADVFFGSSANEVEKLQTGSGDDTVYADGSSSLASSNGGNDLIETGTGRDVVLGGAGNDWIEGGSDADVLTGNVGNDVIYSDTSSGQTLTLDQTVNAGETATAVGGTGELLSGDAGDDFVYGANTSDLTLGGDGKDVIVGGGGHDTIYGDAAVSAATIDWSLTRSQTGSGGAVNFNVQFTNVTTTGNDSTGALDIIYGGTGDDWIFAGAGDDSVEGGAGNDVILGQAGNDALVGGAGNDFLDGDSASVDTAGLSGDDFLDGGEGNDILLGSKGNDILYGGDGDDELNGGDGADTLYGGAGVDVLVGGAGKDTYVFNRGDGTEVIQDTPAGANDPEASVLILGEGISASDVKFRLGSLMVDLGQGDAIHINGAEGWNPQDPLSTPVLDSIQFADGSSMTYADVLAQGFDLDGTEESDTIEGTAVTDRIRGFGGSDTLVGFDGEDTLTGGTGNDLLIGGGGKDTYVFNRSDGIDVVQELPNGSPQESVLTLGAGISRSDIKFRLGVDDSLMVDTGQGDTISFTGFIPDDPMDGQVLGEIQFAEGEAMSYADVLEQGFDLDGNENDNLIHGTAVTDRITGFGGDDVITAGAGEDTILGGEGGDDIDAGAGNDVLDGGAGDDVLQGGEGNDTITTGEGADIVAGGAGDDTVVAGEGDVVADYEGVNHLDLTAYSALNVTNLEVTQYEADGGETYLSLHVRDPENQGTTPATGGLSIRSGELGGFATLTLNNGIGGTGGTVTLTHQQLMSQYAAGAFEFRGSEGSDAMFGTQGGDRIFGGAGADALTGNAGDDTLDGGAGEDTLSGGVGKDTYALGFNTGRDTVIEDGNEDSDNTIQLDPGITRAMLKAEQSGDDLALSIGATGDALLIKDYYTRPQAWQENWTIREAGAEEGFSIAALQSVPPPLAGDWLAAQKTAFRTRREQAFGAGREAQEYAATGGNAYKKVEWGFNYEAQVSTTTTTVNRLVTSTLTSSAAAINAEWVSTWA